MSDNAKSLFKNSIQLRGILLDATVDIERKIDNYIASYFCNSEHLEIELKESLLHTEKITLGNKKDLYFSIIDKNHKEFLKTNPKFKSIFEELIPHRNILAHADIDYSNADLDPGTIVFKRYKNGKIDYKKYDVTKVEEIKNMFVELNRLMDLLKPTKPPLTSSPAED